VVLIGTVGEGCKEKLVPFPILLSLFGEVLFDFLAYLLARPGIGPISLYTGFLNLDALLLPLIEFLSLLTLLKVFYFKVKPELGPPIWLLF
jgi:hypothetical protein